MKPHDRHPLSLHFGLKFFIALIMLVGGFTNFSVAEAAVKPDRTPPTKPANLHMTGRTDSSVTLAWNKSTDLHGVKNYTVYQNNKVLGTTVSTQYTVKNLRPGTTYSFFIKAQDTKGNISASSNINKAATAVKDQPPKVSTIQVSPIASDGQTVSGTIKLSVTASDDKGIQKVNFYSNNGGYLIKSLTAPPYTATWATDPWVSNGQQTLKVVVYDTANQTAQAIKTVTVNNVKVTVAPVQSAYKMIGYYTSWSTYSNYQIANIDASKLTQLNYAFANISDDGKIEMGDAWADVQKPFPGDTSSQPLKGNFNQLLKLKQQNPNLKTIISVGGWSGSQKFSDVALTDQSRTVFANSVLQFILQYGFDGVDLDWEYPVTGGESGNTYRPEDKQNFTLLLQKIRSVFDAQSAQDGKKYIITIAGGAGKSYAANTELNLIQQYVDYIQLMTYDIHGSWDTLTGLNAPLYRDPSSKFYAEWSVQDAVQMYLNNGVPANKLIMGVPFYARVYNQVNNVNNGLYTSFTGGGSAITYANLAANYLNKNGFIRYWDAASDVPWLFNGSQFVSYDDEESMGYKTSFIKSMGLGGAMMWELSQDPNEVLLTKIYNDLK
ncbi:fibronectin type III domain-containing protein [Bacillus sp. BRMEA1]|uniref:glycosyl hydrolase family 18 protein n=1 Tax=Neobacillus endophyticus TaxID=2738405 RepID=UPI00156475C5|nr:glycosyl hydrolase family 18 protein [Neobacillus endophyticus]NRD76897.1 fibronectin type III domain-containing protein [Neobacillus endophyticus]